MDIQAYDARADTIDVDDIATDSNNRAILRRLRRNELVSASYHKTLFIQNEHDDQDDCNEYIPEGSHDMGWLGYFIGKNDHLKKLVIEPFTPPSGASVRDVIEPFLRGVNCNTSIRDIDLADMDMLEGRVFTILGSFFQNNYNLTNINIENCDFGDVGCRLFALALGKCAHKSLRKVGLADNNISEEGMVDIITALSMYPQLQKLNLCGNRLRKNGCVALATLLYSAKKLKYLYISSNDIGDGGIEALVPALKNCNHLREIWLSNNPTITTKGWQSLATILESPNSNLEELGISQNNVDDIAVAAFANAVVSNRTLHTLYLGGDRNLGGNPLITTKGWEALSKVLCDTSSINATFLSNHTISYLSENAIIEPFLHLNRSGDKKEVATIKMLQNHNDFDMLPFFEWEFKVLPLVVNWLERASEYEMPDDFEPKIEERKLSTIYQFVRGLPLLYVETRLRKELEDIKALESQMMRTNEEFPPRLDQRRKAIMRRLGRQ